MTDPMDDVDYDVKDFSLDEGEERLSPWLTDSHFIYHLEQGGVPGELLCSPRKLSSMCIMEMVNHPDDIGSMQCGDIPNGLYPALLTEAILNQELQSIFYLVSRWPLPILDIMPLLPQEENIGPKYLTQPLGKHSTISLLDCLMHSLLCLVDTSPLRVVNFAGFKQDKKLSKELARLPLLWIHPDKRDPEMICDVISKTIDVSEDTVEQYINKINCVYTHMDPHVKHGQAIGPITIVFECRFCLEDVAFGLALQEMTPFKFACHRLWMCPVPEADLSLCEIQNVLQPRDITHLEFISPGVCEDPSLYMELLEGLTQLPNLVALGLPDTVHVDLHPGAGEELNTALKRLSMLRKLNLQSCNVKDKLDSVLSGLNQLIYLNISDCRLSTVDVEYLLNWKGLATLQEIDVGNNNFQSISSLCMTLLSRMTQIVCLGLSYSCFTDTGLKDVVKQCQELTSLKVLSIQGFVPLSKENMDIILSECAKMPSLQRCKILPEAYAFIGNNELERNKNKELTLQHGQTTLQNLSRSDIALE